MSSPFKADEELLNVLSGGEGLLLTPSKGQESPTPLQEGENDSSTPPQKGARRPKSEEVLHHLEEDEE